MNIDFMTFSFQSEDAIEEILDEVMDDFEDAETLKKQSATNPKHDCQVHSI